MGKAEYKLISPSFLVWILVCMLFLHYFDKNEKTSEDIENHSMINSDPKKYWTGAFHISQQIKTSGYPLVAGEGRRYTFLYPRLLACKLFTVIDSRLGILQKDNKKL